jgi:uncharacterized protein YkwD
MRDRLSRIAERHAGRMADRGAPFHSDLGKKLPGAQAGEVVGYGQSVDAVFTEPMASGSHRDILLGTAWRKTGVGVVRHGGRVWVTQIVRDGASATLRAPRLRRGGEVRGELVAVGRAGGHR